MTPVRCAAFVVCVLLTARGRADVQNSEPLALVDGHAISAQDVEVRASGPLRELHTKEFDIKNRALIALINERLLNQEAQRRRQSVEQLLEQVVYSKLSAPTSKEIESYYLGVKDRIDQPLVAVRDQIADYLAESQRTSAYEAYLAGLRAHAAITVLLAPPRATVSIDPTRVRGAATAPITIVEFADYECPYCADEEVTVRQLLAKYSTQVRLAYRDFPLEAHPQALPLAEASRCALAQGKFWEFHDALFANRLKLEISKPDEIATQVGVDSVKFDECIRRHAFATEVQRDLRDGEELGIAGTPAFFVNGIALSGAVPFADFARVIDLELPRIKK